jgi:hypothetical protein
MAASLLLLHLSVFLLALIHRNAWNRNSRKFISKILHSPGPNEPESWRHTPIYWTGRHYMLWCWIDMRRTG